jgi:hypothetical protein
MTRPVAVGCATAADAAGALPILPGVPERRSLACDRKRHWTSPYLHDIVLLKVTRHKKGRNFA